MTRLIPILMLAWPAFAQPDPAADLTPALVIAAAREAYRTGPTADEVTVRLRNGDRSRTARFVVRLDPRAAAPCFRLEMADHLIVSVAGTALVAAHTDNENDRWIVEVGGADLSGILSHLPPVPTPQLHLAFDSSSRFDQPTPYTPGAVWDTVESPPIGPLVQSPELLLRGRSDSGAVEAVFDARSMRLRSFHGQLTGGRSLELSSVPIEAGDPAGWPIVTAGRNPVPNLSDLAVQRGLIVPGEYVPDLGDATGWSLHAALAALPPAPTGAPQSSAALALICFRVSSDPIALATAEASARLAIRATRPAADRVPALDSHLIAAIDLPRHDDPWSALLQRWGVEAAQGLTPGRAAPSVTIDRFAPDAPAALILIAPDRRLLTVIPLDAQADAGDLADQIAAAIR